MADWFQQNAPSATGAAAAPAGDWFTTNAPASEKSIGERALSNLPRSLKNLALNAPVLSGLPPGSPEVDPNGPKQTLRNPLTGKTTEVVKLPAPDPVGEVSRLGKAALEWMKNPIRSTQEAFAEDPAGTVLIPAGIAAGGVKALANSRFTVPVAKAAMAGVKAAAPDAMIGATKVAAGAAFDEMGIPYHAGALVGAHSGLPQIGRGLVKGAQAAREYYRTAMTDAAAAAHRAANPPMAVDPVEQPPVADLPPIPSALPSGRIPGPAPVNKISRPAPAWEQLPESAAVDPQEAAPIVPADRILPSGRRVPVPGQAPNPITQSLDRAKLTVDARGPNQPEELPAAAAVAPAPEPSPAAPTALQETAAKLAPSGVPRETQDLADTYHARGDVPAPLAAAKKDLAIAEHMRSKGITADVFKNVSDAQRKAWGQDAKYSGISSDPKRVADVAELLRKSPPTTPMTAATEAEILQNAKRELGVFDDAAPPAKNGVVLLMPSREMKNSLNRPGAAKAAAKLYNKLKGPE